MVASYFGEKFKQGPSTLAISPPPLGGGRHLATASPPPHPGRPLRANTGDCKGGGGTNVLQPPRPKAPSFGRTSTAQGLCEQRGIGETHLPSTAGFFLSEGMPNAEDAGPSSAQHEESPTATATPVYADAPFAKFSMAEKPEGPPRSQPQDPPATENNAHQEVPQGRKSSRIAAVHAQVPSKAPLGSPTTTPRSKILAEPKQLLSNIATNIRRRQTGGSIPLGIGAPPGGPGMQLGVTANCTSKLQCMHA